LADFDSLSTGSPGALILITKANNEIAIKVGIKTIILFKIYLNILLIIQV
jgi:hypothetical protein